MNGEKIIAFIRSKTFLSLVFVTFGLAILAGVFCIGVIVGVNKARFSNSWGDNYQRNFSGPRNPMMDGFNGRGFVDGHGVSGQIISINGSTLTIKGLDNNERAVLISDDTVIRRFQEDIKIGDLQIDDNVVIIGQPNSNGQIDAKLIRVMPEIVPMPMMPGIRRDI